MPSPRVVLAVLLALVAGCRRPATEPGDAFARHRDAATAGPAVVLDTADVGRRAESAAIPAFLPLGNGLTVFAADTVSSGSELWRTDGTAAGTYLLVEGAPGRTGSSPAVLCASHGIGYFQPRTGAKTLWRTDGRVAGTFDLGVSPTGGCAAAGDGVVFASGGRLYTSDGTIGGTRILTTFPVAIGAFASLGHLALFVASDGASGLELWRTDGTAAGTALVKDLAPGPADSNPREFVVSGTRAFFRASQAGGAVDLWASDGNEAHVVFSSATPAAVHDVVAFGSGIAFATPNGVYASDGTPEGTQKASGIAPTYRAGIPSLVSIGSELVFLTGSDLYRNDGTLGGTAMFASLPKTGSPALIGISGRVLVSYPSGPAPQLYASDGSTALASLAASATAITDLGDGTVLFDSAGTTPPGVWRTDGTPEGTSLVASVRVRRGADASPVAKIGSNAVVLVNSLDVAQQLWTTDGTPAGTQQLVAPDTLPRFDATVLPSGFLADSRIFLAAQPFGTIYTTDGTGTGTRLISGVDYNYIGRIVLDGPFAVLVRTYQPQDLIYGSNGTYAGTTSLARGAVDSVFAARGRVFFHVKTSTTDALHVAVDAFTDRVVTPVGSFFGLGVIDERLIFSSNGHVYVTDGTSPGTDLGITGSIEPLADGSYGRGIGSRFFFVKGGTPSEIWVTDGSVAGTHATGAGWAPADAPPWFAEIAGRLAWLAPGPDGGYGLWVTDGTTAGTSFVDQTPGIDRTQPGKPLGFVGSVLLFSATTKSAGTELWRGGLVPGSVGFLQDLYPGVGSSNPDRLLVLPDRAVFSAEDGEGRQLFVVPAAAIDGPPTLACPRRWELEATGPGGARVTGAAAALGARDGESVPTLVVSPAEGTALALGSTTAGSATLTDVAGQSVTCTFAIHVRDGTPPAP